MRQGQQGMTAIGFLVIASLVAMIGYGAIRLVPIYLTQMKITKLMNDLKDEYDGAGPTPAKLKSAATRTAVRGGRTFVDTTVAMAFAVSWNPFT